MFHWKLGAGGRPVAFFRSSRIDGEFQKPFVAPDAQMSLAELDRGQPKFTLAPAILERHLHMTLVLGLTGRDSIWMLTDWRLSSRNRTVKNDAVKTMILQRGQDRGLLGYAGLGATANRVQPSDWMNDVLRGRNLPFEQSLVVLGNAIKAQIPRHLLTVAQGPHVHTVVVPAVVGGKMKFYSIDLTLRPNGDHQIDCNDHQSGSPSRPPRIGIAGSGARYLLPQRKRLIGLLRLVAAHEREKISAITVAQALAAINAEIAAKDQTVGNRCLVVWRYRTNVPKRGGGGSEYYNGIDRENGPMVPTNVDGGDVSGLLSTVDPFMFKLLADLMAGKAEAKLDEQGMNEAIGRLPSDPDEKLR